MGNNALIQGLLIMIRYTGLNGEVNMNDYGIYAGPEAEDAELMAPEDITELEKYGWQFDDDIQRWYLN